MLTVEVPLDSLSVYYRMTGSRACRVLRQVSSTLKIMARNRLSGCECKNMALSSHSPSSSFVVKVLVEWNFLKFCIAEIKVNFIVLQLVKSEGRLCLDLKFNSYLQCYSIVCNRIQ